MPPTFLRLSRFIAPTFPLQRSSLRTFTTTKPLAAKVDSDLISRITAAENTLTNSDEPAPGGPTARAQAHAGSELTPKIIRDIAEGEKTITGRSDPVKGGPISVAQKVLTAAVFASTSTSTSSSPNRSTSRTSSSSSQSRGQHSGVLDSDTIADITAAEKKLSGQDQPIKGGPTAKAQQHAGEPITSEALHDITEGEKMITGGERVKGGPTSTAQSALGKSRES